ncbi:MULTISPECIES: preprotein translocase subunit SecG [unclassified Sphingomonas]|uniref:preprotein translocase subunit SecG n=1 Tax=unclassified Sphingomonas TaxID=196159 RepID=UPI0010561259|nr:MULTISPECIES: preprotein translocase subunit SecG [unclassified Sphingomonas]MDD1452795.1 preprotein translocase subunit SecG [Sphingomonas sp. H160509]TCP94344.1 protein translocase subunit secG [Sphingomonas sp. PP-CE-1A-559]
MFAFLLVIHAIIAAALVTVILMQRSEGGGLGMGGSPSGLMSARGAADFLTRATGVLATMFVLFSILLAVLAANHRTTTIDTSLARTPAAATTVPTAQPKGDAAPFAGGAENAGVPAGTTKPADNGAVPLAN